MNLTDKNNNIMTDKKLIRALIVEDMPMARENLRLQLQMIDNIDIIGEASNVDDARELIFKHRPQLVFLDIGLPDKNGFQLLDELKELPEIKLDVIFVTSHRELAAKSFDYYPFNFLNKPVDRQKLKEVLDKYTNYKFGANFEQRVEEFHKVKNRIHFKGEDGFIWLNPEDILWCKADRNYTEIYLANGEKEIIAENISSIEKLLAENQFFKTHRSFIVNISKINKIVKRNGKIILYDNPFNTNPLVAINNINALVEIMGE